MEEDYPPKKNCKKIHRYCDRSQYGEIGWYQRLKKQFHLYFCAHCRNYSKKNCKLTQTIKNSNLSFLKPHEIQTLKQRLDKSLRQ